MVNPAETNTGLIQGLHHDILKYVGFSEDDIRQAEKISQSCQGQVCTGAANPAQQLLVQYFQVLKGSEANGFNAQSGVKTFQDPALRDLGSQEADRGPLPTFDKKKNPVADRLYHCLLEQKFTPDEIDGTGDGPWAHKDKEIVPQELYAFIDKHWNDLRVRIALRNSKTPLPQGKEYEGMGFARRMAQFHLNRVDRLGKMDPKKYQLAIRGNLQWVTFYEPNSAASHRILANQYLDEGNTAAALRSFQAAYNVDPSDENRLWVGHAHFANGDFLEARADYTELLRKNPHDATLLRLRIESNQYLLKARQASDTENDAKVSNEEIAREIGCDLALLKAVTAVEERGRLAELQKKLAQAHDLSAEQKRELVETLLTLGKSYLDLGQAQFADPADAELVRKELNGLAEQSFGILSEFVQADPDADLKKTAPLYEGYRLLAKGEIDSAVEKFTAIRADSPEADAILKSLETQKLRLMNLAAVEAWKTYNKEGKQIQGENYRSVFGHTMGFIDYLVRSDGETIHDDLAQRWARQEILVNEIEKRIVNGSANTIKEALQAIKDDNISFVSEDTRQLAKGYLDNPVYIERGWVLSHLIEFTSKNPPDVDTAQNLLQKTFELEADNNAVEAPFAIYTLIHAFAPDEKIKGYAKEDMEALQGNSGFGRSALKLVYQTGIESLAIDVALMFASAGLGNLAKLAAMAKLERAGITGYKALAIAGAAGLTTEATALWGLQTGKAAMTQDVSKVFSPEHLAKSYGATLLMVGFTKGFGKAGQTVTPRAAKALGLMKNGQLTAGGRALAWGISHGSGMGGLITAGKTSQAVGFSQAPVGGWKESLVHDVVTYVEFAVVHKAVDGGSGGKLSKVSARQREQIAARERHLLDITRVTYHERLGVPKPPESQPKEGGMVVDATAQAELDFDTAPTRVFRRPPLPAEPSLEVAGQRIALPQLAGFNAVILGRRGDVVVAQANETKISGRHATIRSHVVKGERVFEICDGAIGENGQWLSSVNQTKIIRNGKDVPVSDRNFTALQAGDIIVLGSRNGGEVLRIPWHPPTKPNADVHGSDTVVAGSWAKVYPRIAQENQFAEHNFIDGQLTDGIELPSRRVKFLKGAGRFTEKETDNREKTIWDRSKDPVADDFLNEVTAEVREKLGVSNLDPSHPQFEQHLNFAMNYYLARLRAEFRNPKDTGEVIERNSDAFADRYRGESVLVGEFMIQKFPVCRHLTPLTQGFLADLGVRNVRMQRGRLVNGAHVWNEVQINGQRRVIDITLAFGSEKPNQSALLPQGQELLYLPEQKGNASE